MAQKGNTWVDFVWGKLTFSAWECSVGFAELLEDCGMKSLWYSNYKGQSLGRFLVSEVAAP